jgi:hypothetical protein
MRAGKKNPMLILFQIRNLITNSQQSTTVSDKLYCRIGTMHSSGETTFAGTWGRLSSVSAHVSKHIDEPCWPKHVIHRSVVAWALRLATMGVS